MDLRCWRFGRRRGVGRLGGSAGRAWAAGLLAAAVALASSACGGAAGTPSRGARTAGPAAYRTSETAPAPAAPSGGQAAPSQTGGSSGAADLLMGRANLGRVVAPAFTLTDQFGRPVSLSQFRGRVVLLAFMDDECTTICPLTAASLQDALNLLGPAARHVQLLAVNANPTAVATKDVYAFAQAHGMLHSLQFLTGPIARLKAVWRAYHIYVAVVHGSIDHTPALFLIGPGGHERYLYLTSGRYGVVGEEAQSLAWDVAHVLPAGLAQVAPPPRPGPDPIASPAVRTQVPALRPGDPALRLGGGGARVVVFFASWVPGARTRLEALDAYVRWAKRSGGPPLVALDEAETEPSATAARTRLRGLALAYPVGVDAHGYLADAYGAQDLAWVAVVSAGGQVVAHHDGWVSAASLIRQVKGSLRLPAASDVARTDPTAGTTG